MWKQVLAVLCFFAVLCLRRAASYQAKSHFLQHQLHRLHLQRATTPAPAPAPFNRHRLRHGRFPHLDGLLSKMDRTAAAAAVAATPRSPAWTTTTSRPYLDDTDDEDSDWDEDDDFDEEDAEEEDEGEEEGWQAEEGTKAPETLTEFKWKHYGTRGGVEESRKNHPDVMNQARQMLRSRATEHAARMAREARCDVPRARVVPVTSVYPDPSKTYLPHCTVLHRCGDDAGCCRNNAHVCAPKNVDAVELYFYVKIVGRGDHVVEKLQFVNHTQCECVDKNSMMSGDRPQHQQQRTPLVRSGVNFKSPVTKEVQVAPTPMKWCKCPELYTPFLLGSRCRCDCVEGNRDCNRIKKGKEFFSLKSRLCIRNNECTQPTCEFGSYISQSGRCPRKQEKFDAFSRISLH